MKKTPDESFLVDPETEIIDKDVNNFLRKENQRIIIIIRILKIIPNRQIKKSQ